MNAIRTLHVTTPSDREILFTRDFDAPRELVFDAHTQPELLKRWLHGPDGWRLEVCEVDLRVGGTYRFVWRHPERGDMGMGGVHKQILRPQRIVRTELFDQDWTGGETLGTATFVSRGSGTTLTITVLYSSKEARDGALATGMTDGMSASYDQLDEILAA